MSKLKNRLAVLVVSCDKYSDLWEPFFTLFWRFWPDCPFNVYLLSNNIDPAMPRVKSLLIGDDISWSDNLRKSLLQLEEEYVFLFIEDLFLYDFVDTDEVLGVIGNAIDNEANYIRLNALPMPDKKFNEKIGIISKGTIYRSSVVSAVWKKSALLDLLKQGESAWDFEIFGSVRSDKYDGFYATWGNELPVINGVIKGKWRRCAVKKCRSLGFEVDLNKRLIMTRIEATAFSLKQLRTTLLNLLPAKHRRKIKDFILREKVNMVLQPVKNTIKRSLLYEIIGPVWQKIDKQFAYVAYLWVSQLIDPVKLIKGIPRFFSYFNDLVKYKKFDGSELIRFRDLYPCIHDKTAGQGFDRHYFYQDIWAAKKIHESKCKHHVDVGSRVDFVAFLTIITKVTYIDIRPLIAKLENFESKNASILSLPYEANSIKSLSCLHVAEHIGIGRYGDQIDPKGTIKAASELSRVLAPGGNLYFSLPVGKPRICFNAHRIHSVQQILDYFSNLQLVELAGIDDNRNFFRNVDKVVLDMCDYGCGLFRFTKNTTNQSES